MNKLRKEETLLKLLVILFNIVEANKTQPIEHVDRRYIDAEGLVVKYFFHASSALCLYRGTRVPELKASFFDAGSINVLCRAAYETFLVFNHVFAEPKSDSDKDFRYYSWELSGLIGRQKYEAITSHGKEVLAREEKLIEPLREKIRCNPFFSKISHKQQRKLIENGRWQISSWKDMGITAGLSDMHAESFYNHLCGYAHSGNISVTQLHQAITAESQQELCAATLNVLAIATANMINAFMKVFPNLETIVKSDAEAIELIKLWIHIGGAKLANGTLDNFKEV